MTNLTSKHRMMFHGLLWLVAIIGTPLILTTAITQPQNRLLSAAWDLGHVPFFFALVWLLLNALNSQRNKLYQLILVNISTILLSIFLEIIQYYIGREFNWSDIYSNCLGSSLAVLFHPRSYSRTSMVQNVLRGICIALIGLSTIPLFKQSIVLAQSHYSFPVLSNFEFGLEIERWQGDNLTIRAATDKRNHILSKTFTTEEFSSITLDQFPSNWENFDCLGFSVLSNQQSPVLLSLKIHDFAHQKSGFDFSDRYNDQIKINPGNNAIVVDLNDVKHSPEGRTMNMKNIQKISLFTHYSSFSFELQFDDFELFNKNTCG